MSRRDFDDPHDTGDAGDGRMLGRPGGDWQGMRPSFDNPFSWSLPLMRVGGINVRIHLLFLLFIIVRLLRAMVPSKDATLPETDVMIAGISMAALFVIVLAHEFGHCLACRWMNGDANEILMWPLGGLAFCRPPTKALAHLITAAGGPLVNVVLCIVAGLTLGFITGHWMGIALPNPLTFGGLYDPDVSRSVVYQTLYLLNAISLMLLLFNLLPIFPLDGGRIFQAMAWPRLGYARSMIIAVRAGYIGAILLGLFGAVMSQWELVGVALFGGITCYITQKQMQWTDDLLGYESDSFALSLHGQDEPEPEHSSPADKRAQREAEGQAKRDLQEAVAVDAILQKIAASGMSSLSRAERNLLTRVTERKRQNP